MWTHIVNLSFSIFSSITQCALSTLFFSYVMQERRNDNYSKNLHVCTNVYFQVMFSQPKLLLLLKLSIHVLGKVATNMFSDKWSPTDWHHHSANTIFPLQSISEDCSRHIFLSACSPFKTLASPSFLKWQELLLMKKDI